MMFFADVGSGQVIQGFGLQAGIVIMALVGSLIFTVKLLLQAYAKYDTRAEAELQRAMETRDKIMEPLEKQGQLMQQIYDIILRNNRGN